MTAGFLEFLKKYSVIGLAIAVVIGGKVNALVSATVNDIIMPIIGLVLPDGSWQMWELSIGPLDLMLGHWLGAAVDFLVVAYIVYAFTKYILREELSR